MLRYHIYITTSALCGEVPCVHHYISVVHVKTGDVVVTSVLRYVMHVKTGPVDVTSVRNVEVCHACENGSCSSDISAGC